jgi:hypothetical protein
MLKKALPVVPGFIKFLFPVENLNHPLLNDLVDAEILGKGCSIS